MQLAEKAGYSPIILPEIPLKRQLSRQLPSRDCPGNPYESMGFMADLDLRPERRDKLAAELRVMFEALTPGSEARLRGSLATGTADRYSDIDLLWPVPDSDFSNALSAVPGVLASKSSVRTSPDYARSDRRRLAFIRLAGFPLFWRIDLDIRARSIAREHDYDDNNPTARDTAGWSCPASAIENAIAAIKSTVRGQTDVTAGLLSRGYERIGLVLHQNEPVPAQVVRLADGCATLDTGLLRLAAEVREVAISLLGSWVKESRGQLRLPKRPERDSNAGPTA